MTPLLLALALSVQAPATVTTDQAKALIGKEATVCGTVKSARYASNSNRKPTFLNLDKAFPDPVFTVVIFDENRSKFSPPPESQFKDKAICVTGRIQEYRGAPEIIVTDPKQIAAGK
jgi:DNA/RNA endonuclease YhcR with UshA esterase domain